MDWFNFTWDFNDTIVNISDFQASELLQLLSADVFEQLTHEFYGYKNPKNIVLMILYSIVFIIGLFGNVFVISVVVRYRHMRTLTNVFLVSLTVGDLLVTCVCIPMTLGGYVYTDFIFGRFLCKLTPFLQGTAVAVSSLSLLSISINRYFAIHCPLKAKILFSRNKIFVLLFVVWFVAFSGFLPILFVSEVYTIGIPNIYERRICMEQWSSPQRKQIYSIFVFILLFLLPLYAMVFTYTRIGFTLWTTKGKSITNITSHAQAERILRQRRRTVKMLVAVVSVFFICWFPYYIVMFWLDFNTDNNENAAYITDYVYPITLWLGLSNSSINPVFYCLMSNGFKRALVKLICRNDIKTRSTVTMNVRFRTSDTSPVDSVETAFSHSVISSATYKLSPRKY